MKPTDFTAEHVNALAEIRILLEKSRISADLVRQLEIEAALLQIAILKISESQKSG